jgi:pyruvate/2-oxoglutarate dehydrogenase complex dihydrolipoamide dehydrogenase (E3) component
MVRAAQVLAEAGRVDELAGTSSADPDWAVVARRVKQVSDGWDDTRAAERLAKTGATLLRGRGVITGPGNVYIDDQSFTARAGLVIASGAEPAIPAIEGLSGVPYWTNREAIEAEAVPRSLIVLGAGAVGLELAQVFRRFGAEVTVVEAAGHVLPGEERENAAAMEETLRQAGITVITGATIATAGNSGDHVTAELTGGARLEADRLLVATDSEGTRHEAAASEVMAGKAKPACVALAVESTTNATPARLGTQSRTGPGHPPVDPFGQHAAIYVGVVFLEPTLASSRQERTWARRDSGRSGAGS